MIEISDVFKMIGGAGGVMVLILGGLFGLSKLRNSKLRSTFDKMAGEVLQDTGQVKQIELSISKDEEKEKAVDKQIENVDQQLAKVDKEPEKPATNSNIIDMFDKLSKS